MGRAQSWAEFALMTPLVFVNGVPTEIPADQAVESLGGFVQTGSIDSNLRRLFDDKGVVTVSWLDRQLISEQGTVVVSWHAGVLEVYDGNNLVLGQGKGTQIGTDPTQKLAFFGTVPVAQPGGDIVAALVSLGLVTNPTVPTTYLAGKLSLDQIGLIS